MFEYHEVKRLVRRAVSKTAWRWKKRLAVKDLKIRELEEFKIRYETQKEISLYLQNKLDAAQRENNVIGRRREAIAQTRRWIVT